MGKSLVIVESPAKAKTINKILGKDFVVKASMGHVRDLPEKALGVDIEKNFTPKYTAVKGKSKVLKELRDIAKNADAVYLAPDPDREGEAIAWHLQAALKKQVKEENFYRVTYNEITEPAIREAFANPRQLDMQRVDSQQARRVLDRIVGYQVSPLLWKRIRGASSAGRVQSVALNLVCQREKEILAFVPEKYWVMGAVMAKKDLKPGDKATLPFESRLVGIDDEKADVRDAELADRVVKDLEAAEFAVADQKRSEVKKKARAPFITSTLQQAASSFYGYSPSRTMSIAQRLYEGSDVGVGLITYMRTDSVSIAKQAQEAARAFVGKQYGPDFVPAKPNFYKSRSSAQEAHEAIRPTDVALTPESLSGQLDADELKLYTLIWRRFMASQMAPARIARRAIDITASAGGHNYRFRASCSEIVFPGYMAATGVEKDKEQDGAAADALPQVEMGEAIQCNELICDAKETKPPARFSEASLVRSLEENGVGRPSTYAAIISTIQSREYITREKRQLTPTELGMKVHEFLAKYLDELFNVDFTAAMEEQLDQVESGDVNWTDMMAKFYDSFKDWLEKAKGPAADPAHVRIILDLLKNVQEWKPPKHNGRRMFDEKEFTDSVEEQLEAGEKAVSERQFNALIQITAGYAEQLPTWPETAASVGVDAASIVVVVEEPPRPESIEKVAAMKDVTFDEARKVGRRTYDDKKFVTSLGRQVNGGKRLSDRQLESLNRMLLKYASQIGGADELAKRFDLSSPEAEDIEDDGTTSKLLALLDDIKTWREPTKRGKRTWDDKEFAESLRSQYGTKKQLSPRQLAALKKTIGRYADQIPTYDAVTEELGLKPRESE